MSMVEDMSVFFNTLEHAVDALWKGTTTVQVIFDNAYAETYNTNGTTPIVHVATNSMPSVARGEAMVINAVNYTIKNIEPNGTGVSVLELQKV
jgi:hypothetical protein